MSTDHDRLSMAHALGAREVIRPHLSPTPLRQYPSLDRCIGARVYIKHENHNPTGTFKVRGGLPLLEDRRNRHRPQHHLCRRRGNRNGLRGSI